MITAHFATDLHQLIFRCFGNRDSVISFRAIPALKTTCFHPANVLRFVTDLTRSLHSFRKSDLQKRNMCYNVMECARLEPHEFPTLA